MKRTVNAGAIEEWLPDKTTKLKLTITPGDADETEPMVVNIDLDRTHKPATIIDAQEQPNTGGNKDYYLHRLNMVKYTVVQAIEEILTYRLFRQSTSVILEVPRVKEGEDGRLSLVIKEEPD